jgi:hypothetical protein
VRFEISHHKLQARLPFIVASWYQTCTQLLAKSPVLPHADMPDQPCWNVSCSGRPCSTDGQTRVCQARAVVMQPNDHSSPHQHDAPLDSQQQLAVSCHCSITCANQSVGTQWLKASSLSLLHPSTHPSTHPSVCCIRLLIASHPSTRSTSLRCTSYGRGSPSLHALLCAFIMQRSSCKYPQ